MKTLSKEINEDVRIFCENIRLLRKANGLFKKEMARKLEISVKSLTALENGVIPNALTTRMIVPLLREFGIAPVDIFKPLSLKP